MEKNAKSLLPKAYYAALFLLATTLMIGMGRGTQGTADFELPTVIQQHYSCTTGAAAPTEKLTIYTSTATVARTLANMLCDHPVVQRQYSHIRAHWGGGDSGQFRFVGKGLGDLVNSKDHILKALDAESTYNYVRLASYTPYRAYLIGLREKPSISREYLMGKRIGLVDYPTSRSGHIIPMNLLSRLGLRENQVSIVYSDSHSGLRELLAKGEVDMISSYWSEQDAERFSENYRQPIGQEGISGNSWYMKMSSRNTDLFCALQDTLSSLSAQQRSAYLENLQFTEGCPFQVVGN